MDGENLFSFVWQGAKTRAPLNLQRPVKQSLNPANFKYLGGCGEWVFKAWLKEVIFQKWNVIRKGDVVQELGACFSFWNADECIYGR